MIPLVGAVPRSRLGAIKRDEDIPGPTLCLERGGPALVRVRCVVAGCQRVTVDGIDPSAEFASPVVVKGIARGWFDHTDVPSWSPTYLGGVNEEGAECNGVVFPVTSAELDSYARRETGYRPMKIVSSQVTMLDGGSALPDGDIWYFANTRKRFASVEHPIVQSYVDVCLNGCLEIEAMYPLAKQASFAEQFIATTGNWGPPWINDRIHPWRPFLYVPRAWAIDALLQKVLGQEMFAQITLK